MTNPIKTIKLNNLQYNSNRDPQVFRRVVNKPFRLQVILGGTGNANVTLTTGDNTLSQQTVNLPGTFDCDVKFDTAASHLGTVSVEVNGETFKDYVRFDVTDGPWHV
ncbi:MAG: hypothetical protein OEX07_02670 [Gammaproteobacteria bacterium]|nr:hypothetical protein [Gammaproteobacteria bacterium]